VGKEPLEENEGRLLPDPSPRFMSFGDEPIHPKDLPEAGFFKRCGFQQNGQMLAMRPPKGVKLGPQVGRITGSQDHNSHGRWQFGDYLNGDLARPAAKLYPAPMPSVVREPREYTASSLKITDVLEIEQTDGTRTRSGNRNRRVDQTRRRQCHYLKWPHRRSPNDSMRLDISRS
jgi:hypothetical protein